MLVRELIEKLQQFDGELHIEMVADNTDPEPYVSFGTLQNVEYWGEEMPSAIAMIIKIDHGRCPYCQGDLNDPNAIYKAVWKGNTPV